MIQTAADLTPTAARMLDSLPDYYWNNVTVLRQLQAWANEIDRIDGLLDAMKNGFVPSLADDTLGLLALWERIMRLPVRPAATIAQRQTVLVRAWQRRMAVSAADVMAILGSGAVSVVRDTPALLHDILQIAGSADTYTAGQIAIQAEKMWPAHRLLGIEYAGGFELDRAELDRDDF